MKRLLYTALVLTFIITACSKYNGPSPQTKPVVTINGITYNTVIIGRQTWTSENYASSDSVSNMGDKFYTYAQALAVPLPAGWRLPTQTDFNNLMTSSGGTPGDQQMTVNTHASELMAKIGWIDNTGTDSLGFDAQGDGFVNTGTPLLPEAYQYEALFWCATLSTYSYTQVLLIQQVTLPATVGLGAFPATDYASVRFVKDN